MPEFNDPKGDFNPYAPPSAFADGPAQEQQEDEVQILAERGTRWVARLIDTILWVITAIPAGFVFMSEKDQIPLGAGLSLITLGFLGYQWYRVANTGQTLGKKWMGIKVVKLDGSPVNFVSAVLLREWVLSLAGLIPGIGRVIGLVDAVMIFGKDRRCMHDQIAGTKVILAMPGI